MSATGCRGSRCVLHLKNKKRRKRILVNGGKNAANRSKSGVEVCNIWLLTLLVLLFLIGYFSRGIPEAQFLNYFTSSMRSSWVNFLPQYLHKWWLGTKPRIRPCPFWMLGIKEDNVQFKQVFILIKNRHLFCMLKNGMLALIKRVTS